MRLIDADNIREKIERWLASCEAWREETRNNNALSHLCARQAVFTLSDIKLALDSTPTADAVPVVRCKDCKYSDDMPGGRYCSYGVCVDCCVQDDFYCANGERREN